MKQFFTEKEPPFRFSLHTLFKVMTIIAALMIVAISLRQYQKSGVTLFRASWPPELLALIDDLPAEVQQDLSDLRLYNNSFIDREYFWRFNGSQKAFDALVDKFRLHKFNGVEAPFHGRELSRRWRMPNSTVQFATQYFGRESPDLDGFQLVISYDDDSRLLHGWLHFDF